MSESGTRLRSELAQDPDGVTATVPPAAQTDDNIKRELHAGIRRAARRISRLHAVSIVARGLLLILIIVRGVLDLSGLLGKSHILSLWLLGIGLLVLLCAFPTGWVAGRLGRRMVPALDDADDVRLVGPLIDALAFTDETLRLAIREALTRLLPRVGPHDGHLTEPTRLAALHGLLESTNVKAETKVAILRALVYVGDETSLACAERVAKRNRLPSDLVRDTARECLPPLRERLEAQEAAPTLLRPAAPPAGEMLLRPALPAPGVDPETLLRPTEQGER